MLTIKLSISFFTEIIKKKTIPRVIQNHKRPQTDKTTLNKKKSTGGTIIPDLKMILQSHSNKNNMALAHTQKKRHVDQWNKTED